jgi:radical SAM-linked protein
MTLLSARATRAQGRRAAAHGRETSTETIRQPAPQKWAIWFAVDGDLRFLSHHEMMRTVERIVARAQLPVRYSQGVNPRPVLSLASARPVGVAAAAELLVVSLDRPAEAERLLPALNGCAPSGMRFLRAEVLRTRAAPRLTGADYRLELSPAKADAVRERLAGLRRQPAWPVERAVQAGRRGRARRAPAKRTIDLRPLLASVTLEGLTLRLSFQPAGRRGPARARCFGSSASTSKETWPKPSELGRHTNTNPFPMIPRQGGQDPPKARKRDRQWQRKC